MKFFLSLFVAAALMTVVQAQTQKTQVQPRKTQKIQKVQAQPQPGRTPVSGDEYEFFSLAFFPGVSTSPDYVNVYGVRVGAPVSFGEHSFVAGTELAIFTAMTSEIYGLQSAGLFVTSEKVEGVQFSIVNYAKEVFGLQLGIVNISEDAAFQIGVVNYIKNSKIPFMPLINICF